MIHVTFRKEGFKTFSANFPPCARSNAHITHESYSHWRIMLPRRLLAFLVIGGVLAVSAAYFRAGGPRISESPSKKARMTSSSEPPDPKHGPASMVVAMGGAAGILLGLRSLSLLFSGNSSIMAQRPWSLPWAVPLGLRSLSLLFSGNSSIMARSWPTTRCSLTVCLSPWLLSSRSACSPMPSPMLSKLLQSCGTGAAAAAAAATAAAARGGKNLGRGEKLGGGRPGGPGEE